jgi:hypothetical protein
VAFAEIQHAEWRNRPGARGSLKLTAGAQRLVIDFEFFSASQRERMQRLLHQQIPLATQRDWNYFAYKQGLFPPDPAQAPYARIAKWRITAPFFIAAPLVPMIAVLICVARGWPIPYGHVLASAPLLLAIGAFFAWLERHSSEGPRIVPWRESFPWQKYGPGWIAFRLSPLLALVLTIALWSIWQRIGIHPIAASGVVLVIAWLVILGQCLAEDRWQRQADRLAADAAAARARGSAA